MPKAGEKRTRMDWEDWYLLAVHYYGEHGDLLVPEDYVCPTGEKLGRWIEKQRAKYNRTPSVQGHLDGVQIEYLERIGMVWKLETRRARDEWLTVLDRYAAAFGHVDVPRGFAWEGYDLGDWLAKQRQRYAAGELSDEEIGELEARGVNWNPGVRHRTWEDWFADAAAYYAERGDLMVQLDYRTPAGDKLGFWIYRQRDVYMGRKKGRRLTEEQIRRLEGVGMVWDPLAARGDAWERMYGWVRDYKIAHDRLPLWPRDLKAPDGRSMCGWIRTQRQQLAAGSVPPLRADKLSAIGIYPARQTQTVSKAIPVAMK